jgi:CheY-like chemotaxis protein
LPGRRRPEETTMPTGRLLLLEDRDDFRDVLCDHLSSKFQVALAPSGVEGLREIRENAFDIILCDMMMPRMEARCFIGQSRAQDRRRRSGSFFLPAIETILRLSISSTE